MRGRIRGVTWLVLLLALALIAGACGSGTTEGEGDTTGGEASPDATGGQAGGDSDTLVVGATEVPSSLDPARVYEKFASDVLFNTTNRLVEFPAGGTEVGPGLATEWEISDDGLTYTFTLREGVTFQDGSDFTSEDVKWSLERNKNINYPASAAFLLSGIASIEAPDDTTVVITLSEEDSTFLAKLNYTVATILPSDGDTYPEAPEAALEEPTEEEAKSYLNETEVVGTGPYQLTNYTPGESMTLEAFDGYWGDPAPIPTVKVQFFESVAQMKNALEAGEIDLNWNEMGPAERADLQGSDGITITEDSGGRIRYIVLDTTQEPFTDPAVNRAISANIDRQRIIDEVFEGKGKPLFSMVPPSFDSHADYMSDIEAEVPEGVSFELWYPLNKYGDTEADVAETVARSLNEAGFEVTTQSADWAAEYSSNLDNHTYAAYLLGWYPDYVDADDYIYPFYHSEQSFIGYYQSEEMDSLIREEQTLEPGTDERKQVFDQIQQLAAEDMPYIPLYEEGTSVYHRDTVGNVVIDASQQTHWFVMTKE